MCVCGVLCTCVCEGLKWTGEAMAVRGSGSLRARGEGEGGQHEAEEEGS